MEMVAEKPIGNVSWALEFSREKASNMRQQEKAEQLPAGWASHPSETAFTCVHVSLGCRGSWMPWGHGGAGALPGRNSLRSLDSLNLPLH